MPRGEEEVTRAAREWPGARVLRGDEATAGRVSALAAEVDVLHLAGHGRHPGDNPLFSAVELADGPWFGYDIDQLAATPSVVVLSACELGRVAVRSGEEAVGMSAAWLHAGARTVVSSPALVADDVACEVLAGVAPAGQPGGGTGRRACGGVPAVRPARRRRRSCASAPAGDRPATGAANRLDPAGRHRGNAELLPPGRACGGSPRRDCWPPVWPGSGPDT